MYDYEFKYGENYYVCLTEEAKDWVLHVSKQTNMNTLHTKLLTNMGTLYTRLLTNMGIFHRIDKYECSIINCI